MSLEIVPKVWGEERIFARTDRYAGKVLVLRKGFRSSLHHHEKKDETFCVWSGRVGFELGVAGWQVLSPGDTLHIPPGQLHRFTGLEDSEILEVSTQDREDDNFRLDPSGRIP
jgi:quercetin dioxygenase-like cupin family protein